VSRIYDVWMISGFTFLILIEIGFSVIFFFHQKSDPHKMAATCENIDWGVPYYSKYGQGQLSGKTLVVIIPIL